MIFFRFRHLRPRASQGGPAERVLRTVLLVAVFMLVAWAFWANMERRMDNLGARGQLQDPANLLTAAERTIAVDSIKRFQKRFDLPLEVRVLAAPFRPDSWNGKSVLLAVAPASRQVVFTAPPLVRRAMGEDFMEELVDSFAPYFEAAEADAAGPETAGPNKFRPNVSWQDGLFAALAKLERTMAELTR